MFKTYFTIAYRNFIRNKVFSLINVLGLSIGISASLVIFLIVHHDFSFDTFEKDGNRIFRVVSVSTYSENIYPNSGTPGPLHTVIKTAVPGIDVAAGFHLFEDNPKVSVSNVKNAKPKIFKHQSDVIFTDNDYFRLLPYVWLAGSPESLKEPNRLVLSNERARMYFPNENPESLIGKQIVYNDSIVTTITGIVRNFEEKTDFSFQEFISTETIRTAGLSDNYGLNAWNEVRGSSQLFIKLKPNSDSAAVEKQLKSITKKYTAATQSDKSTTNFHLQPLNDIHFNNTFRNFADTNANKPVLYGLLAVAAFLLILASINFINLTTAQSSQRAKEIGIRKTMGSSRKSLVYQFLSETFFVTLSATVLSILFAPLLLRLFSDFIPPDLHFDLPQQPFLFSFLLLLVLAVTLLSGFYPALVLSGYKPITALKNQAFSGSSGTRKSFLRKSLTVSQFFIAQFFVIATLITVKQIHFMLNKDIGVKKDAIIFVGIPLNNDNTHTDDNRRSIFMHELRQMKGVRLISMGNNTPTSSNVWSQLLSFKDGKKEIETDVHIKNGDTNYLKLYQIKLIAGRNVEMSDTTKEYIINETYMHSLGFQNPNDIINKKISRVPIIGVIKDFNQQSLHTPIVPLAFSANNNVSHIIHIALKSRDEDKSSWKSTIADIEKSYRKIYPTEDFEYQFFDESIAKFYKSEQDISRLMVWATGLAVFISCIGLLGLVVYTTSLRKKEIGIRKVLGASVHHLVAILSADFIRLVFIAFLISAPLAWWLMNKWLEDFSYHIKINGWLFVFSCLIMMTIALITLSIQTVRTALANPVDSLRTE